ncbi:forkhead box protein O1-A-like isoform X2 [Diabrotica virgifera virgifera]|uniref:Fork-head domain-containing protein n=1 Tax=Diabrotica virgifera virgifera TaxID=50390 RepID=A0ABM5IIK8_DIAVI|nr:forkhead box protein O1-A-like isoform X2 [Diabrotica virgifera virgifera]
MDNNMIIRNYLDENLTPTKIEYIDPSDNGRVVSQSYGPQTLHPSSDRMNCSFPISFPEISIKTEEDIKSEVVLVNGCWDTTNRIPNIVVEMHVNTKDINGLNNCTLKNGDFDSPRDVTSPSPRGSDSGIESDCTEGSLSWLLNYKIQELPPVPDATATETVNRNVNLIQDNYSIRPQIVQVPTIVKPCDAKGNCSHSCRYSGQKKPPFTYTELIEYALSVKGELTVSGIYQWISDHFPFYKQNDDRWKNSVRHNLSINPHFRKGGKAVQGAGHLWTIAQRDAQKCAQIKQRISQFFQNFYADSHSTPQDPLEKELEAATQSILGEINPSYTIQTSRSNTIEVEYVNIEESTNGLEDFLAPPVSKEDIVNECGLGNDIFITDINPNVLGLNLAEVEGMADTYEDVFEYYTTKE